MASPHNKVNKLVFLTALHNTENDIYIFFIKLYEGESNMQLCKKNGGFFGKTIL
jgi:hypothetical protein